MRSGGEQTRAGGASELGKDFEVHPEHESMMRTENLSHVPVLPYSMAAPLAIRPLPRGQGIGHPSGSGDSKLAPAGLYPVPQA